MVQLKGVSATYAPVTEKYNPSKDFFRYRMRSTSPASPDWEVLQAVVGFAFTIQQEYLRLRRDTSAMLNTLAQQQMASVQAGSPPALKRIVASAHNLTEASGAAIALGNEQGMVCVARSGASSPPLGSRFDSRSGLSGECIRTRESVICMNAAADPRVDFNACTALGIRSMVYRPILNKGKLIGVLAVFSSRAQHFSYRDINCLKWTDELISEALQGHENQVGIAALIRESIVPENASATTPAVKETPKAIVAPPQPPKKVLEQPKVIEAATVVLEPPKPKEPPTFVGRIVDESVDDELPSFEAKEEPYDSPIPMLVAAIMVLAFLVVVGLMSYFHLSPKTPVIPKTTTTTPAPQTATPPVQATPPPVAQESATGEKAEANPTEEVPTTAKSVAEFPSGINFDSTPAKAVLNIALKQPITYQGFAIKNPERLYFDLKGATLVGPKGTSVVVNSGLVSRIRISQHSEDTTRIVFDLREPVDFYAVQSVNPQRLSIELHPKAIAVEGSQAPVGASAVTIVIDPGHGGNDEGAISESGLKEKDVTLDLAQRLGMLLEKRLGAKVVYTRTTDDFVSLADRVTLANDSHADFMISIHGNSSSFRSVRGLETYYFKNTQEALALAADATRTAKPDGDPDAARNFAADVHRALLRGLDDGATKNRGVKSASFVVLRDAHMPAVLAEVAFISSRKDAKRLESSAYRDKVAKALYQGISNHVARRDGRILSAKNSRDSSTLAAR